MPIRNVFRYVFPQVQGHTLSYPCDHCEIVGSAHIKLTTGVACTPSGTEHFMYDTICFWPMCLWPVYSAVYIPFRTVNMCCAAWPCVLKYRSHMCRPHVWQCPRNACANSTSFDSLNETCVSALWLKKPLVRTTGLPLNPSLLIIPMVAIREWLVRFYYHLVTPIGKKHDVSSNESVFNLVVACAVAAVSQAWTGCFVWKVLRPKMHPVWPWMLVWMVSILCVVSSAFPSRRCGRAALVNCAPTTARPLPCVRMCPVLSLRRPMCARWNQELQNAYQLLATTPASSVRRTGIYDTSCAARRAWQMHEGGFLHVLPFFVYTYMFVSVSLNLSRLCFYSTEKNPLKWF